MDRETFETEPCADNLKNLRSEWQGFRLNTWNETVNVRDFIQANYTLYRGDGSFLTGATDRTEKLWAQVKELMEQERQKGVLAADTAASLPMPPATSIGGWSRWLVCKPTSP